MPTFDLATPIRLATAADIPELTPLVDAYRRFYRQPGDLEGARAFLTQRFANGDAHLLLALDAQGSAHGFVQLFPVPSTTSLAVRWILNDLFVAPEARGQGMGSDLLRAARQLARDHGVPQLMLRTQVENHTAQSRYQALGWQRDEAFFTYLLNTDC
ncbi:GNAT family N-acetyltransferase [Salinicola sp. JS01]|uniref:GNAT family N-acetyltransferase n=1 Tax=Salinicola sp. JS01 TaxID=3050071 RepID=UPI00255BF6ED|nr:GNAT family N-acetyltransferase [Salinicola sp. JS01]WIX31772.1 GNAT family N-acetyltransferase [Salinicola sp. JS01]